ncbi:MAG: hypothetical protein KDD35_04495, partial [Bdellovibrionales bacterium]|nr:hypothetical protein [Bdellovibrionales bacterium]
MAAFRLSRNVTLAMLVVTSSLFSTLFLVLSPSQSRAGTTPPPAAGQAYVVAQPSFCDKLIADPNSARQSFDLLCKGKGTTCVETALSKKIEECMKMATGSQSEQKDCNSSYEKFVENNGKMNAACGGAGIDGDCFAHVNKCLKCQGTDVNYSDCASLDTEDVKEDVASINDLMGFGSRTSTSVKYTPDPEKASIRYKNCPAMAGADLKDWISRVKDAQSASADAKRKIVDLTEKSNDIESQLRDTKIEKEKEMQDTVSEAEDVRQEMNNQLDEEKNKARQTISQLLEQSSEIENQIIATQKAYDDAYGTYLNALSALDQQCHAAALQKLTALQSMKQAKIDKSNYSTSSFNRLLGQVGLSSRRVAQKRVNED